MHDVRRLGIVNADLTCACLFWEQQRDAIRALGGIAAFLPDVWGGYDHGAGPLLRRIAGDGGLAAAHGCCVMFAASAEGLHRAQGVSGAVNAHERVQRGLRDDLAAAGYAAEPEPTLGEDFVAQYGMMHQYAVRARRAADARPHHLD